MKPDHARNALVQSILSISPSINAIKKESRRIEISTIQKMLGSDESTILNDVALVTELNDGLTHKNCRLIKDPIKGWQLLDRENTFEQTSESRFKYFLENSDDKKRCVEALSKLMARLSELNLRDRHERHEPFQLLDIGAGDVSCHHTGLTLLLPLTCIPQHP